jgi:hypothetical protein
LEELCLSDFCSINISSSLSLLLLLDDKSSEKQKGPSTDMVMELLLKILSYNCAKTKNMKNDKINEYLLIETIPETSF